MNIPVNRDPRNILGRIRCFALDMDGTFYISDRLIPGSIEFLRKLHDAGRGFVFLTNNSSKSRADYLQKLLGMGVEIGEKQLVSSGQATVRYLRREYPGKRVFLLGNPTLAKEFRDGGIILDDKAPDVVVTAFDTTLDYSKMCKVCDFVRAGLPYIATHPDYNCPVEGGYIPDIGAIHAFIEASTGRRPDSIVGKPHAEIMHCALEQAGYTPDETAMVGDRLYTDMAACENVPGLTGILVLSGESTMEDIETAGVKPHLVFDNLMAIAKLL
jgi:HAD superfamily hydrolase (TIGR01450 family)